MNKTVLFWDNHGTIVEAKDPAHVTTATEKILPGVKTTMEKTPYNFLISGCKNEATDAPGCDAATGIERITALMNTLPLQAAAFSPSPDGTECYVIIKQDNQITVKKAHEEKRYKKYIGHFKKPDIGMLAVMKDIAREEFDLEITEMGCALVGDSISDQKAAEKFGIPFITAEIIHVLMSR